MMPTPEHRLEIAIADGDLAAVRALLDADPALVSVRFAGNVGLTPLMWAARRRHEPVVADLLARGADPSASNRVDADGAGGNTALWFAAQGVAGGGAAIAERLVAAGAGVDVRGEHGQTALYVAAAWAHVDVVERLCDLGADPSLPDVGGRTPLVRVRDDLAWCDRQPILTPDQQRFRRLGPAVRDFLARVAGA